MLYILQRLASLFLLRVLEIKCFKSQINTYDLISFMRDFRIVDKGDGNYVNISNNQAVKEKIKNLTGLTNLDALYLTVIMSIFIDTYSHILYDDLQKRNEADFCR